MPILPPFPTHLLGMMRNDLGFKLFEAALAGAQTLMSYWCAANPARAKADGSMVSDADHAADVSVREALARLGIEGPLVSEEAVAPDTSAPETFLLLDPLDGTQDFLEHGTEFCVCLAAIHQGRALAGAIVAPALQRGWFAGDVSYAVELDDKLALKAKPSRIHNTDRAEPLQPSALVSRRNGDARSLAALRMCGAQSTTMASSAIKFGMLAEGTADIHIRHGRTMAWDIAAGDAILTAAGGMVRSVSGVPLSYGGDRHDFSNPSFIAVSNPKLLEPVLDAVQRVN